MTSVIVAHRAATMSTKNRERTGEKSVDLIKTSFLIEWSSFRLAKTDITCARDNKFRFRKSPSRRTVPDENHRFIGRWLLTSFTDNTKNLLFIAVPWPFRHQTQDDKVWRHENVLICASRAFRFLLQYHHWHFSAGKRGFFAWVTAAVKTSRQQ